MRSPLSIAIHILPSACQLTRCCASAWWATDSLQSACQPQVELSRFPTRALCVDLRHALPHSRRHEDRRFLRQFINLRPAPRTPPTTTTSAFMFSPWSSPRSSFLLASLLAYSLGSSPATTTLHLQPSLYGLRIGRDEWHRSLQQELQAFQA